MRISTCGALALRLNPLPGWCDRTPPVDHVTGTSVTLAFELTCSRGTVLMDFERMNELQICTSGQPHARTGFTTILAGPEHPNFGAFTSASGHHIGFNDLKTIEAKIFIDAICDGTAAWPDFRDGWRAQQVIEAVARSSVAGRWVKTSEM